MTTLFQQLLADPYAQRQILANVTAYNGSTTTTLRYSESGFASKPTDSVPNEFWDARIVEKPLVRRSMFAPGRIGGRADADYGSLVLANASETTTTLDALRTYAFDGRAVELRMVGTLSNGTVVGYDDGGTVFSGTCAGDAVLTEETVTLRLRGYEWLFDKPVQQRTYRGMSHCLAFDGSNDYATFNTHTSQYACTIEFWMRCDGDNGAVTTQVVGEHATAHAAATVDWYFQISTAGVLSAVIHRTQASPTTLTMSGVDVRDGWFHHVALSLQSGSGLAKLYWDGELVASGTAPTFAAIAAATLTFGSLTGGSSNCFNGRIDEVRFWKSALTQAQIQATMNTEIASPVAASMFGYWKLNDNTGTSPADSSGNGKTGTLPGATATPTWSSSLSGDANLAGTPIPIVYGAVADAQPVLIDASRLIYQVHDGRNGQPLNRISSVYDKGVSIAGFTPDLTRGLVTLSANPAGTITVDCDGESTFGGAMQFDGTTGYVSSSAVSPANSLTMEALVNFSSTAAATFAVSSWRNGATNIRRLRLVGTGTGAAQFFFDVRNDVGTFFSIQSGNLSPNRWYHLAGVLDTSSGLIRGFVDGVEISPAIAVSGTFANTLTGHAIGREPDASADFLPGAVDEVRVWNVARTQQQLQDNGSKELAGTETGLVQYWKFNDRSGSTVANSVSGGSAGTTHGTTAWVQSRQSAWDLARRVVASKTSVTSFDDDGMTAANALNAAACGMYVTDPNATIGDVLDYVLSGPGGYHYFSRSGVYTVGQFTAPTSGGTAYTTLEILDDQPMEQQGLEPPVYRVEIGWRKNWTVQGENDIAGALSAASQASRRAFVTKEWRFEPAVSTTVQTAYSGADVLSVQASLYNQSDAQSEAQRGLALYGTHREHWSVALQAEPYSLDVGQSINLTRPRFGLDSGRDFVVVGFDESEDFVTVDVWG